MGSKKITNLVLMAIIAFALILAIQGVLGVLEKFKSGEQASRGVTPTTVPLLPAIDLDLSQDITPEDIQKIRSAFGDGSGSGLQDQLGQGLSSEDLQQALDQAEFLACAAQGRTWNMVKETCN